MENFLGSVSLGLKVCLVLAVIPRISRTYFIMAKRTKALMGWLTMDRRDPYCIQSTVEGNLILHRPPFKGVLGRISLPWPDSYLSSEERLICIQKMHTDVQNCHFMQFVKGSC